MRREGEPAAGHAVPVGAQRHSGFSPVPLPGSRRSVLHGESGGGGVGRLVVIGAGGGQALLGEWAASVVPKGLRSRITAASSSIRPAQR